MTQADPDVGQEIPDLVHDLGNVLTALFGTVDVMQLSALELPLWAREDLERLARLTQRAGDLNAELLRCVVDAATPKGD